MIPHYQLLLQVFVANIFLIWGFYLATRVDFHDDKHPEKGYVEDSKNIFWRVKYYSLKYLGKFWSKTVCTCTVCMSSTHSIILYSLFLYSIQWDWRYLVGWLLYVPALGTTNYFISLVANKLEE